MFDRGSIFGTMTAEASAQPRLVGPAIPVRSNYGRQALVAQQFHRAHTVPSVVPQFAGVGAGVGALVLGPYQGGVVQAAGGYAGFGGLAGLIGFG